MPVETTLKVVDRLKGLVISAFNFARDFHVEPAFNEAAEGEGDSGGMAYHGFEKGILPALREACMADGKQNVVLRNMKANSANFTRMHLSKG